MASAQAGYNVLNAVIDYDYNDGKLAAKHPDKFYIELMYKKRISFNKLGKNVTVTYDLTSVESGE